VYRNEIEYFDFKKNRSERAKQAELLVPVLKNKDTRFDFLSKIDGISKAESDKARVMHFVWVLRDTFTHERDNGNIDPECLVQKWCRRLELPDWCKNLDWWRHPKGNYKGDKEFVVHPCNNKIGWTETGIQERVKNFKLTPPSKDYMDKLIDARKVMNTECDCFIQTPERLIAIECKDKTSLGREQKERQAKLFKYIENLLPRTNKLVYILVCDKKDHPWSWDKLKSILNNRRSI